MGNRKIKVKVKIDLQSNKSITLEHFFQLHENFLQEKSYEGLANRTLESYRQNLKYFKKFLESAYQSQYTDMVIDTDLFKQYVYHMQNDKEYNPFTINIRLRTLKTYLKWLYDEKYISANINLKIKKVKVPQDFTVPLDVMDIKKLLQGCDTSTYAGFREYCVIVLILDCGIRIHELCALKFPDVDLRQGLIKVEAVTTKTRNSRYLPISVKTCKLIKQLIDISQEGEGDYVFQSTYGGAIKPANISLSLNRIREKTGIKKVCTPYTLRHTFATNSVKLGMDIFTLQRIMGHQTLLTTRKYIQLETEDLKKKHDKINPIDKYL